MKITRRQLNQLVKRELLNEGILGTVASAVLSMPAILDKIAKMMELAARKLDKEKLELRGKKLEHFAHDLHEIYRKPIKKTIQFATFKKDLTEEQLEKYTDIFFAILIAGMMIYTGVQVKKEIRHLGKHFELATLGLTLLETALGSIEVGEEFDLISKLRNKDNQQSLSDAIDAHAKKEGIH